MLKKLLCWHDWKLEKVEDGAEWNTLAHHGFYPIPVRIYFFVCKKCGKSKRREV